jgi:protein TonB
MSPMVLLTLSFLQITAPEPPATPVRDVEAVGARTVREGVVTLECTVLQDGRVSRCVVLSETPPGQGFGEAALRKARQARLSPQNAGGKIRFTTRFQLQD